MTLLRQVWDPHVGTVAPGSRRSAGAAGAGVEVLGALSAAQDERVARRLGLARPGQRRVVMVRRVPSGAGNSVNLTGIDAAVSERAVVERWDHHAAEAAFVPRQRHCLQAPARGAGHAAQTVNPA